MLGDNRQHLPSGSLTFGIVLFLASLGMLFAASMVGYVIIRVAHAEEWAFSSMRPPDLLWVSTILMLASSVTIHWTVASVAHEKQSRFRGGLLATLLLAVAFIAVQIPALADLLAIHHTSANDNLFIYGLVFFLIFLHALHILGGLIPIIFIVHKAFHDGYDHERYAPVRCLGYYWHFLGGVWITMFSLFMVMG